MQINILTACRRLDCFTFKITKRANISLWILPCSVQSLEALPPSPKVGEHLPRPLQREEGTPPPTAPTHMHSFARRFAVTLESRMTAI